MIRISTTVMRFAVFHITLSCLLLLPQQIAFSQSEWTKEQLEKANTAKEISYLTEKEKAVILYSNLVRTNPLLFKNTYLKNYLDSTGMNKNNSYVKSLLKTLETTDGREALIPSKSLHTIAKAHAVSFGKSGKTGHGNFDKRFDKYFNHCTCAIAENCDYGNAEALDIVMSLLIDEGVSNLGHRKNLLNAAYKNIGVSISTHKKYRQSCVMDFSSSLSND